MTNENIKKIRPIFNYIGGKSWLREKLRKNFELVHISRNTANITHYVEPFCGGLGVFINVYDILLRMRIKHVILNDINKNIINFYHDITESKSELLEEYMKIENDFILLIDEDTKKLNKTKNKAEIKEKLKNADIFFRKVKEDFNDDTIKKDLKRSARLLFLQNHCFNGVYRENGSGKYNTPFNWDRKIYKKENIEKKLDDLLEIIAMFESVSFTNDDYKNVKMNNETLIYCDPPYINEKPEGENKYNKSGFNKQAQIELIKKISPYNFIYSNHDNDLLIKTFKEHSNILITRVNRKNIMSSKNSTRSEDKVEILVIKWNS